MHLALVVLAGLGVGAFAEPKFGSLRSSQESDPFADPRASAHHNILSKFSGKKNANPLGKGMMIPNRPMARAHSSSAPYMARKHELAAKEQKWLQIGDRNLKMIEADASIEPEEKAHARQQWTEHIKGHVKADLSQLLEELGNIPGTQEPQQEIARTNEEKVNKLMQEIIATNSQLSALRNHRSRPISPGHTSSLGSSHGSGNLGSSRGSSQLGSPRGSSQYGS